MGEENQKEYKAKIAEVLEKERRIGYELGYSLGKSDGAKEMSEVIQTELMFRKLLTDDQMMGFFALSEQRLNELKEQINTPEWLLEHLRKNS